MQADQPSRAAVVGAHGQDGQLLAVELDAAGYSVARLSRSALEVAGESPVAPVDLLSPEAVEGFVASFRPDEVYYLAAHHGSSEATTGGDPTDLLEKSFAVHVCGYQNFLTAAVKHQRAIRFFYAASSHVFGWPTVRPQTEATPFDPQCAYGVTKAAGVFLGRYYRRAFGIHASAGILYNHESYLRRPGFASRRIAETVARIANGSDELLLLGDLDAVVDWGYAPDYVRAMRQIIELPFADDFIIATGDAHTIRDFVAAAFASVGIGDWANHVAVNPSLITGKPRNLLGDSSKLKVCTGWRPSVSFEGMVSLLVAHYMRTLS